MGSNIFNQYMNTHMGKKVPQANALQDRKSKLTKEENISLSLRFEWWSLMTKQHFCLV
jgi:hypothetical protein